MRVVVYKNLNKGCWSIAEATRTGGRGRLLRYAESVALRDVVFTVKEARRLVVTAKACHMFEAFQERPVYWDNMRFDRSVTLLRGGDNRDWISSWHRVAREHASIDEAIAYAKRILAQRPGCPVEIRECGLGRNARVAQVSRDALGRVWCDSFDDKGLI